MATTEAVRSWRHSCGAVVFAFLACMLVLATSAGATVLPTTISSNTTLTAGGNPYTGSPTIASGVTLKVEPGVRFKIGNMEVKGTLDVDGTAEAPVVFTGSKEAAPGEWARVAFNPGSSASVVDHAEFRYGGSATSTIVISESSPRITNSKISYSSTRGIEINAGSPEIDHNEVLGSTSTGIYFNGNKGKINIHDNYVEGGNYGISVTASLTGTVAGQTLGGNVVAKTKIRAFYYSGPDIPGDITENTLSENSSNVITIKEGRVPSNSLWNDGGTPVKIEGTLQVKSGATLTITQGVRLINPETNVEGTLNVQGTAAEPVIFTGSNEAAPGEWGRVYFYPSSSASVIDHAEFKYGGGATGSTIVISESSPRITNSKISYSSSRGIDIGGGGPEIDHSEVIGSATTGIYYDGNSSTSSDRVNIHDNYVEGGNYGISVSIPSPGLATGKSLGGNTVVKTKTRALSYTGPDIPGDITENTLSENSSNVITVKEGRIVSTSTWNDGGTPIKIEGTLQVKSGATLTITQGLRLINPETNVEGTLNVQGTAAEPVVFTGSKEEVPGEWGRVLFYPGSSASVINHAEFKYGGGATGSTIVISEASPTITNSKIAYSSSRGIDLDEGAAEIMHNDLVGNATTAIYYDGNTSTSSDQVNIHDNYVEGGNYGITVSIPSGDQATGKSLGGNTIIKTTARALSYSGPDIPGDITQNTLSDNSSDDIRVAGTVAHSSTWKYGGSAVRFTSTVGIPAGITLVIEPAIYIRSPQMNVVGTLHVEGTKAWPVTLTGSGELEGGEWDYIRFAKGSSASTINYANIGFGGSSGSMVIVEGASPTITNSALRRSKGNAILVTAGQPTIEGIRFRNNQFGLRYEGEGKLAAQHNDWGCANGPKPTGCGDGVTSNVDWQPASVLQELPRFCPGTVISTTSNACLLQKYQPTLRLDSEENYLPDDAAELTDNWGDEAGFHHQGELGYYTNVLLDGSSPISEAAPWGINSMFPLNLDALRTNYPSYGASDGDDWIDEANEYVRDAHLMEESGYADASYGRVIADAGGNKWLEYWYWYYYNPKSFAGIGTHEGDWESVLVGLDANSRPSKVIFSQHESPSNCYIGDVEQTTEGGPVVYVALDSHANYRMPGNFDGGVVTDYADGGGPTVRPGLVNLETMTPSWVSWPGHWGNSRGGGLNSESPTGPAFHGAWINPAEYAFFADECSRTMEEESEEDFEMASSGTGNADLSAVTFENRQPRVEYEVPGADGEGFWPRLRLSVNELGDGGIPPVSKTISAVKARGGTKIPVWVKPGKTAEVLGSIVYKDGRRVHLAPMKVHSP